MFKRDPKELKSVSVKYINRRNFLRSCCIMALPVVLEGSITGNRPNILFIITDQQFGDGMSCVLGKKYLHTPNMDSMAEAGMRFTRAYSPNPLCVPMRSSTFTGQFPHQTKVQSNTKGGINLEDRIFLGKAFKEAGYETAYFGKWHIPLKTNKTDIHGFDIFEEKSARLDPGPVSKYIKQKHSRPFFVVASFLSPHEICQWARKEDLPGGPLPEVPPMKQRPMMRKNSGIPENESDSMALIRKSYHNTTTFPVGDYTEDDWRRHIWGYYRLIERVDGFIGTVLKALRESGKDKNTVVLFVSDHGDCHGAHCFNQKTVFYDESVRIPCILSGKGITSKATSDVLVNIGIDVFPTLCDFASIKIPSGLPGKSMRDPVLGKKPDWKRDYIVSQNYMVQGGDVDGVQPKIHGRMVRSDRYKYCLYSHGKNRESLIDMKNDPGEMKNLAKSKAYVKALNQHRAMLKEHGVQYKDQLSLDMLDQNYQGELFQKQKSKKKKKTKKKKK